MKRSPFFSWQCVSEITFTDHCTPSCYPVAVEVLGVYPNIILGNALGASCS